MIEADRVSKSYSRHIHAVRDVSVTVQPGQVTGLLGPNGAGKSTLIRMICSILTPTSGQVKVCGHDTVIESGKARACVGYLPESAPLYPEMQVRDYLNYRARLFSMARAARKVAVERAIERCWLKEMSTRRIGALSKGYRQRVGLASAILHSPRVVILDEPTTGLDPSQIRETRGLIREIAKDTVVLLSSHILPEVEQTCDRVLIIARGKLRADGTPDELLAGLRRSAPYIVEVNAPRPDAAFVPSAKSVLEQVLGVASVTVQRSADARDSATIARFSIVPHAGAPDLRQPIARACENAGLLVSELHRVAPTLEQVFLSVIEERDDAPVNHGSAA